MRKKKSNQLKKQNALNNRISSKWEKTASKKEVDRKITSNLRRKVIKKKHQK